MSVRGCTGDEGDLAVRMVRVGNTEFQNLMVREFGISLSSAEATHAAVTLILPNVSTWAMNRPCSAPSWVTCTTNMHHEYSVLQNQEIFKRFGKNTPEGVLLNIEVHAMYA